ncbi:MAG: HD domain-containing protein [Candidatus Nanoarchaeia archaeon]
MNLPSLKDCEKLLDEFCVPGHVKDHSRKVAEIAVFIAKKLNEQGVRVDTELVKAAALLHDIAKPMEFSEKTKASEECLKIWKNLKNNYSGHTEAGYYLLKNDYPEIADIIRRHAYKAVVSADLYPASWEAKLVTYADKRVAHDQIVSLAQRFEEGHKRWRQNFPHTYESKAEIERIDNEYFKIEKEIFAKAKISPDSINDKNVKGLL